MSANRRGFILPTTLMVMTLLTVMLTAAFILVSAESRATDNSLAMGRAHALAQAGLQKYLTLNRGIVPAANSDSIRLTFSAGYADVVGSRLVAPNANGVALWLVRSTGVLSGATLTGTTTARRVVAQLATFNPGVLPLRAALVAAHQVQILGSFGAQAVLGTDYCSVTNKPGLTIVPADLLNGAGLTIEAGIASRAAVLDSSHIDWATLLAGNFTPDYTLPTLPVWNGYPIGYAPGNATLPGAGIGILVVAGDLTINPLTFWDGIVIVGGRVRSLSGLSRVRGAVISGLNNLVTPNSVGPDSLQRGIFPAVQWDSCQAGYAVAAMAAMAPLKNVYMDTWAAY